MSFFSKIIIFLKEVNLEVKKINWPTREETIKYTLVVIGMSVALAVYLGGIDVVFTTMLNRFILR